MGITSSPEWKTKAQIVEAINAELGGRLLESKTVGSEHWTLLQFAEGPIIILYLLSKPEHGQIGWGYKDISESEFPYYYKVPKKWFAKASVRNRRWRDAVESHTCKLVVGDRFSYFGTIFTVEAAKGTKVVGRNVDPTLTPELDKQFYTFNRSDIVKV